MTATYRRSENEGNWMVFDSLEALVATVGSESDARMICAALDRSLARPPMRRAFLVLCGVVFGWCAGILAGVVL